MCFVWSSIAVTTVRLLAGGKKGAQLLTDAIIIPRPPFSPFLYTLHYIDTLRPVFFLRVEKVKKNREKKTQVFSPRAPAVWCQAPLSEISGAREKHSSSSFFIFFFFTTAVTQELWCFFLSLSSFFGCWMGGGLLSAFFCFGFSLFIIIMWRFPRAFSPPVFFFSFLSFPSIFLLLLLLQRPSLLLLLETTVLVTRNG